MTIKIDQNPRTIQLVKAFHIKLRCVHTIQWIKSHDHGLNPIKLAHGSCAWLSKIVKTRFKVEVLA